MWSIRRKLRHFAWWILETVKPPEDEVTAAMRAAFVECGLNIKDFHGEFNLQQAGKFHEVQYHAMQKLGMKVVTVDDLSDLLR